METGNWEIAIEIGRIPQKIASAIIDLEEKLVGVEYEPIAYLGSQVVNGVNHAVLAKQILTTGRDSENIVVLIFNEKNNNVVLVSIERVMSGSDAVFGGIRLDVKNITIEWDEEANFVFTNAFKEFTGAKMVPYCLLGTQIVRGVNYFYLAEMRGLGENDKKKAVLVIVNSATDVVNIIDILTNKFTDSAKYSFTL